MMPKGSTAWNKGKGKGYTDKRGYRVISISENGERRQVREHRYIMEQHLGRKLQPDELVHHINGDSTDNRIENLQVMTFDVHAALHHNGSKRLGRTKRHMEVLANYREENKRLSDLNSELLAALKGILRLNIVGSIEAIGEATQRARLGAKHRGYELVKTARAAIAKVEGKQ